MGEKTRIRVVIANLTFESDKGVTGEVTTSVTVGKKTRTQTRRIGTKAARPAPFSTEDRG